MKVLVVKLTSMGDVIHALPALTDAQLALPDISVDFLVEESFQEIPAWHPAVQRVIPVATRRWRKSLLKSHKEISSAISTIRSVDYDAIIDIQGLMKSAVLCRIAKGKRYGYDRNSIREAFASRLYNKAFPVAKNWHAIDRVRTLFSSALGYSVPSLPSVHDDDLNYAINFQDKTTLLDHLKLEMHDENYCVFLHGTTWRSKEWPEKNWRELLESFSNEQKTIYLPWGNVQEKQRAERLQKNLNHVEVLPKMNLSQLGVLIAKAQGVVAVDTGLGHLSAALGRPTISIYGPTDTTLIGTIGENQQHLKVADVGMGAKVKKSAEFDYTSISADKVKQSLLNLMAQHKTRNA